jgi:glutamate-1-semialdehyde 2,1-aminomutase
LERPLKVVAIVQARMGSTRLPNKVMQPVSTGMPMIEVLFSRLSKSTEIDEIVLATSDQPVNKVLVDHVSKLGYTVYQGSENDVLDRYYQAALQHNSDLVVRITGDCPLIDSEIVDSVINVYRSADVDYISNTNPPTYPDGLDVEVFSFATLTTAWKEAKSTPEREHVTPYIRESGKFKKDNVANSDDLSNERWAVDEPEDYQVIQSIFDYFAPRINFSWTEVLQLKNINPDLFKANQHLIRNEGAKIGTGQKLWKRAKKVIPGGNMLLSKRPEMFLPDQWPSYYSKAKGCKVWDMDSREYIDMSIMGIGTNILGYGHPEVNEVVQKTMEQGNMSTFNCPEEVYLAEKLIELHPWADMARFARSGGEANAIAIRIARAASGKDKVAICGYHGWHDWYLSANLSDDSTLDAHLLPGLDPKGVPRNLKDTVLPFNYNNFTELEILVRNHDIGVIKMEVQRNEPPKDGFLDKIKKLATEEGIVLIFDECTSGFRETFGGLHKKYGVNPDMAVFGKALGNGYAITSVIGSREIMEFAQSTFISSTFWTERIGPAAALKTLEVMEREKSWEQITETGQSIGKRWKNLGEKYGLPTKVGGLSSLINFSIRSDNWLKYKTLITQEMLKQGVLATNSVYVCTEHTSEIIDDYFEKLETLFSLIRECEDGREIDELLEGPVCHSGFKRMN